MAFLRKGDGHEVTYTLLEKPIEEVFGWNEKAVFIALNENNAVVR